MACGEGGLVGWAPGTSYGLWTGGALVAMSTKRPELQRRFRLFCVVMKCWRIALFCRWRREELSTDGSLHASAMPWLSDRVTSLRMNRSRLGGDSHRIKISVTPPPSVLRL